MNRFGQLLGQRGNGELTRYRFVATFARVDGESYNLKFRQCPIGALYGLLQGFERSNG
jgi:hypothetical protein